MNFARASLKIIPLLIASIPILHTTSAQAYSYAVTGVSTPTGATSTVTGVDDLGDASGYITPSSGSTYACLWLNGGTTINLGSSVTTSANSFAYSLTYDSTNYYVVGQAANTSYHNAPQAFLWTINRSTDAVTATNIQGGPVDGSGYSVAYKVVLESGAWKAVGYYRTDVWTSGRLALGFTYYPYVWQSGSAGIAVSTTNYVVANSVNSSGAIVGSYAIHMSSITPQGFFTTEPYTAATLLGDGGMGGDGYLDDNCYTFDINDGAYAVGQWNYNGGGLQGYVWNTTSNTYSLIGGYSCNAINNATDVSGTYYSQIVGDSISSGTYYASVWDSATSTSTPSFPTSPTLLNTLAPTTLGTATISYQHANAVSKAPSGKTLGYIGGTYTTSTGGGPFGYVLAPQL